MGWLAFTLCLGALLWVTVRCALNRRSVYETFIGRGGLLLLWIMTALVLTLRFTQGLGPVSGMSDRFPWGVWIGLDVLSGVALAAGGYVIAATVYLFRIKRFEPILRPTVLTAFLGYIVVAAAIFVDIGRPYRLWHPLVMWQHHSIMFEVSWCVTLYAMVLALEFSPVVFERFGLKKPFNIVKSLTTPIVILGVILSTLHQSSLGSMFLIVPQKLDPLWYSPLLPGFFLISSVAVGMCMTIIESFFSSKVFHRSIELPLLSDLGRAAGIVLLLYLGIKLVDVTTRGVWTRIVDHPLLGISFTMEILLGVMLPAILLVSSKFRRRKNPLFFSSLLVGGGMILNRMNVSWFGMLSSTGNVYCPSWMELTISLFFFTLMVVLFGLAVHHLPIFQKDETTASL